jgi:hypothetical protein
VELLLLAQQTRSFAAPASQTANQQHRAHGSSAAAEQMQCVLVEYSMEIGRPTRQFPAFLRTETREI